jgi:hypothetical protein
MASLWESPCLSDCLKRTYVRRTLDRMIRFAASRSPPEDVRELVDWLAREETAGELVGRLTGRSSPAWASSAPTRWSPSDDHRGGRDA